MYIDNQLFMKKYFITYILFSTLWQTLNAQADTVHLILKPLFGNADLVLEKTYGADSLQITTLRFYLSNFRLLKGQNVVWAEPKSYHLVDAEMPNSTHFSFILPKNLDFDALKCDLGIDSLTNTEGVKDGDLDPTKGMYWAWQSGYINLKLEGTSRLCPTRKNKFQFHIGGFLGNEYALQTLNFPLNKAATHSFYLKFDVQQFLSMIDLKTQHAFMGPSEEAVGMAKKMATVFKGVD